MKLLEYKAKELFESCKVPVMRGCVVDSPDTMEEVITSSGLSYPVVVKAQVQIGGRGKAGGIRFADTPYEAKKHCESLLNTDLLGYRVNKLLIVEKSEHNQAELYLSILLDRITKCPTVIFSAAGGVDIEQTAQTSPDRIFKAVIDPLQGMQDYTACYLLSKAGLDLTLNKQFSQLLKKLYRLFCENDCLLCEINPLVINSEGSLVALDGKIDIDDSALYRLPDILAFRNMLQENPLVEEARAFDFLYIPVEEGGSIAVASNGSGMLMSCIDLISKEGMKVGAALDMGGGATAKRIKEAMRILFSTPGIKAILINIFGGITRCDEVAGGVKLMMESIPSADKIVVIRMEGTNKEKGLHIIEGLSGNIISVPGLRESVRALSDRRDQL